MPLPDAWPGRWRPRPPPLPTSASRPGPHAAGTRSGWPSRATSTGALREALHAFARGGMPEGMLLSGHTEARDVPGDLMDDGLQRVALAYMAGDDKALDALQEKALRLGARRVRLPLTPFQRRRFWPEEDSTGTDGTGREALSHPGVARTLHNCGRKDPLRGPPWRQGTGTHAGTPGSGQEHRPGQPAPRAPARGRRPGIRRGLRSRSCGPASSPAAGRGPGRLFPAHPGRRQGTGRHGALHLYRPRSSRGLAQDRASRHRRPGMLHACGGTRQATRTCPRT